MKLIKPSYQIIEPTGYTIDNIYKSIELVGRVSHKSEDRITEDSAKTFVEKMMKMKHLSTCEFGTVYLKIPVTHWGYLHYSGEDSEYDFDYFPTHRCINPYSRMTIVDNMAYITTNYRVLVENNWLNDLKYLCEPTEYHHKRYTVKFICDRGILAEFTRHRKFSFMAESSRYNNYSKDKFGNELTFIKPCWLTGGMRSNLTYLEWETTLQEIEKSYLMLTKNGWKAEEARSILPLSLKTELYMCGFAEDWEKFFELRCATNAHSQARELAIPLKEEFISKNYLQLE